MRLEEVLEEDFMLMNESALAADFGNCREHTNAKPGGVAKRRPAK
jgi:hypothetical protein